MTFLKDLLSRRDRIRSGNEDAPDLRNGVIIPGLELPLSHGGNRSRARWQVGDGPSGVVAAAVIKKKASEN